MAGYFSDADGDELTYMASSSNADVATATNDGATVTINGVGGGRAVITVTASDGEATVAQGFSVTVEAAPVNSAPSAVGTIPSHSVGVGGTVTVDAAGYFNDADGDELSYTVASSNADVATATADGSTVTISGVAVGSAVITVTASDGEASAVQGFSVAVEAAPSNKRSRRRGDHSEPLRWCGRKRSPSTRWGTSTMPTATNSATRSRVRTPTWPRPPPMGRR